MKPPHTEASDALLVAWMIEGDEECLPELIGRYGNAVGALLRRISPEWEDLAQETWIRVVNHAHRYDPTYAFSTWLFRIAWNRGLSRTKKESFFLSEDASLEAEAPDLHPEDHALQQERKQAVQCGIQELPPHLAEAVMLRYFEDMNEREMSNRLGIPPGTVKSRLHNAHRRLAEILGGM
ncbi:MAG: sigma-70 family RNA polymerase sigma factor [Holophaga sp.]|nr:sigma-70 family RNA polymerase sigma factor [Holophaga sp.]